MSNQNISRRKVIQLIGAATAGAAFAGKAEAHPVQKAPSGKYKFTYCLNMSTIRGQNLGFVKELETAAAAGFRSVEIWMDTMQQYLQSGGTVKDVKTRLDDLGLKVEDCISFNKWIVDDNVIRQNGIEQMKRDMEMLAQIGCKRMAATGMGATDSDVPALDVIASRYRTILDIGNSFGVVPQIEMWGFQKNLQDVAEVIYIAMESRHPSARVLLDVFHLYRGNTSFETLSLMDPNAVEMFHMNDYPAGFQYQTITDADRIYPGDGIAPIKQSLKILLQNRKTPLVLSTELFNKTYYRQDALTVAKTSLAKMKAIVEDLG
ncbi:MAG TPA: sugar phosphate isomerase/epimerase [Mucilaginibacter sp.]|jgi:sugar phosphate isomerase/epimerase|nr:sugar phosphate isomerase/epimerase [Mucilaginibacter sp.]